MDLADWLRLDVPVGQAGMGGGLTGPELAAAVASAGGLGTLGLALPDQLRDSIRQIRDGAPGRAVVMNLLTPFLRRRHVSECVNSRIVAAVVAFAGDRGIGGQAQGCRHFRVRDGGYGPVLLAGGIATGEDTRAALAAGTSGVIAGTRFLLTRESRAHPEYLRRILAARKTFRTTSFGLGWPAPHRAIANVVLLHRPDRRDARFGGRSRRVLRGTDRPADDLDHIGRQAVTDLAPDSASGGQ
ncbi:MAG TPA: nitronate monooxygenase [Mycobacterium sp.]